MPPQPEPHLADRRSRFERFEERLALSAQPITAHDDGLGVGLALDHHGCDITELEPSDFELEINAELTTHLANANQQSGVEYVHQTYGFDGSGQTVVIIDSGIAYDHLALGGGLGSEFRVVGGYDFAEGDADPYDDGPSGFHGTHVAGIVGSSDGTHKGVAPNVDLVALRVFDDSGAGYFSWVEQALSWVHDNRDTFANPITTVNLSLGTSWNADTVPNWTTLEDEFAQLSEDGIFVAASAGNSFADYNEAGLSYPAASPYVVPVASVDDDGNLSSFSQRSDRVLAAPGRGIVSTVPDHVFGGDGNPNDFGSASGTSMASPYVAGASVLVREAMQFVGLSDIDQDSIYDHLRNTADVFYDAATSANYHRINVQAALDALIPDDDFGSSAAEAHALGTVSNQITVSGLLGTLDDQDYFTFTAAATGTVTVNVTGQNEFVTEGELIGSSGVTLTDGTMTVDVSAGQEYTIALRSDAGLGYYDVTLNLEAIDSTIKSVVHAGATYALDSEGWLSIDGRQVWSNTQDFDIGEDGSIVWHGTSGMLQRRDATGTWHSLDNDAVKYAIHESGTIYSLSSDGWLNVEGRQVWGNTQDFAFAGNSRLYWHGTSGGLHSLGSEGGWQSHGNDVVKFDMHETTLYSLDSENWVSVNGRRVWGGTQDFLVTEEGFIWHGTSGDLQRLNWGGSWESISRDVVEFAVRDDGTIYSLSSQSSVSVDGSESWTEISDIRSDAMQSLLMEKTDGDTMRVEGRFSFSSTPQSELTAVDDFFDEIGG